MTPIPILLYHSIGTTASPAYRRWCVEPSLFDEHLDVLGTAGFSTLTVSELVDGRRTESLPDRPLVVTFDDGRADFYDHAAERLQRHGVPATMYVVSSHVGGTSSWLGIPGESDQPLMTWKQLVEIADAGHEIGAHSETHPELDVIPAARAVTEVTGSRRALEAGTSRPVRSFAYPHGYHSARLIEVAGRAGYDSACAVNDRWSWIGEPALALSRLIVAGSTTPEQLLDRLTSPPSAPERRSRILRAGWRRARWARHRSRSRAA